MTAYRILFADNDSDSLLIVKKYLESLGYLVETAEDPDQAREKLRSSYFDLAILDMRLRNNNDITDKSGLEIAKTEARGMPKIINTAYPYIQDAIEAVRKDKEELPPAVDYLDKARGLEGIRQAVEAAISNYLDQRGELSVVWIHRELSSFMQLVSITGHSLSISWTELAGELEMLIRQVFTRYEQITILQVLWSASCRGLIRVSAFHHDVEDYFLVTYGCLDEVKKELELYQTTVPANSVSDLPVIVTQKSSVHLSVIVWSVRGVDLVTARPAKEFFESHSERQIQDSILSLFAIIGETWYHQGRVEEDMSENLCLDTDNPAVSPFTLEKFVENFTTVIQSAFSRNIFPVRLTPAGLQISLLREETETLPNPIDYLFGDRMPVMSGKMVLTLGVRDWDSIMIDAGNRAWPVDFRNICQTTIWRDFATLELETRFNFLEISDLYTLLDFEEQLFSARHLKDTIPNRNVLPNYRRALCIIQTIRKIAAEYFNNDIIGYYTALLSLTARSFMSLSPELKLTGSEILNYTYRVLFMGKICAYLEKNGRAGWNGQQAGEKNSLKIRIDKNSRRVWVGKNEINLTHTEYDILKHLYDTDGVCTRQELLTSVFNFTGQIDKSARNLVNIHINRLRKQIEPDPARPVFILTVRKEGYRLDSRE